MADQTPQHPSTFTVTTSAEGAVGILTLSGSVGMDAEDQLMVGYRDLTASGAKRIRIHFEPRTVINSSGIAVLITLTSQAKKAKQKIEVTGLSAHYRKIIDMIGLTEYWEVK